MIRVLFTCVLSYWSPYSLDICAEPRVLGELGLVILWSHPFILVCSIQISFFMYSLTWKIWKSLRENSWLIKNVVRWNLRLWASYLTFLSLSLLIYKVRIIKPNHLKELFEMMEMFTCGYWAFKNGFCNWETEFILF